MPFSTMQWRTEARKVPATDQPPTNPAAPNGQPPAMKETDPAATEASQGYPDKAILNTSLAELKAAPDFKHAASPVSESEMQPAGGDQMEKDDPIIRPRGGVAISARRSGWLMPPSRSVAHLVGVGSLNRTRRAERKMTAALTAWCERAPPAGREVSLRP